MALIQRRRSGRESKSISSYFSAVPLSGSGTLAYVRLQGDGVIQVLLGVQAFEGHLSKGASIRGVDISPSVPVVRCLLCTVDVVASVVCCNNLNEEATQKETDFSLSADDNGVVLELSMSLRRIPASALLHELLVGLFAAVNAWQAVGVALDEEDDDEAQPLEDVDTIDGVASANMSRSAAARLRHAEILMKHASEMKSKLVADTTSLACSALHATEFPYQHRVMLLEEVQAKKARERERVLQERSETRTRARDVERSKRLRPSIDFGSSNAPATKRRRGPVSGFLSSLGVPSTAKPTAFGESQASSDEDGAVVGLVIDKISTAGAVPSVPVPSRDASISIACSSTGNGSHDGVVAREVTKPDMCDEGDCVASPLRMEKVVEDAPRGSLAATLTLPNIPVKDYEEASRPEAEPLRSVDSLEPPIHSHPANADLYSRSRIASNSGVDVADLVGVRSEAAMDARRDDASQIAYPSDACPANTGEVSTDVSAFRGGENVTRKRKKKKRRTSDRGRLM